MLLWANVWAIRFNPSIDLKKRAFALFFIFYGLAFLSLKSRFSGNSHLCWYVSSFICLLLGSLYAIGGIFFIKLI
ncbi:hypothetical protein EJ062_01675 [Acinetobacter baumannii]|uniref:Uncharacterized protein n=1 Tax=Acinetobacter baumannii TaxID=470 RepID=A0A7X1VJR4_ACIBA|nr:hypothetical protein [Acinetobacter baumannii]MQR19113.1 hypothetical protein [Acinetobacter baumannii]MQR49972.1 hypothetical protein [Acinetobacter baumannii]RTQ85447.1 hypothetical protein EJ062_01675 [Acinetobacter baumannii]TPS63564.1 hypothetical protein FJU47_07405 [Acinetobacter baumannii]